MKIYSFGKDRQPTRFCFMEFNDVKYRIGLHPYKDFMRIPRSENEFVEKMINGMMEEDNPGYVIKALFEWQD